MKIELNSHKRLTSLKTLKRQLYPSFIL